MLMLVLALALVPAPGRARAATASGNVILRARYAGTCDASAGVALDATTFAVASDEDDVLRIYGHPASGASAAPRARVDVGPAPARESTESDLEASARTGRRIYWITSHARTGSGKRVPVR
jgi:hypothetical protein